MADETTTQLTETRVQQLIDTSLVNLRNVTELFKTVSSVPTHTPVNIYQQIVPYVSGTDKRLYWYDLTNNTWRYGVEFDISAHDTADSKFLYKVDAVTSADPSTHTDVFSKSIPANLLGDNGLVIIQIFVSNWTTTGTAKKTSFYWNFGGAQDTILDELTGVQPTAMLGTITGYLVANGATNAQKLYTVFDLYTTSGYKEIFADEFRNTTTSTFTVDTTSAQTLKFQVKITTADASNTFNISDALIYAIQSS